MSFLKSRPAIPLLSERPTNVSTSKTQFNLQKSWMNSIDQCKVIGFRRRISFASNKGGLVCRSAPAKGVDHAGCVGVQDGFLVRDFGWGVRRMVQMDEEMKRVALVQAEAFHVPVALFNDLFFEFFKAEVLSALIYRIRNSPSDRYACLVAESVDAYNLPHASVQEIVGVVDVTVQRDKDILRHLEGAEEYLYVSGIAVLTQFRRQKIATVLLKACDALSVLWGFSHLALQAYEDDSAACELYSNAGYKVVSRDPLWVTWIGKKRRVIMIKQSIVQRTSYG